MIFPTVKVAAVQAAPVFLNLKASVDKACALIDEAGRNGAQLIDFPEAFLPGYPWWIWMRAPSFGHKFLMKLHQNALTYGSSEMRQLSEAARRNNIFVCISATEADGTTLYLTQFWFDNKGNLMGKHRKMSPPGCEKIVWACGNGSTMQVFDTKIGKIGGLQCGEHLNPMNISCLLGQGEQIHCAGWPPMHTPREGQMPLFSPLDMSRTATRYAAMGLRAFALYATQMMAQDVIDMLCDGTGHPEYIECLPNGVDGTLGGGHAAVFNVAGDCISNSLPHDVEGCVYAECNLMETLGRRLVMDPLDKDARPFALRMTLDRTDYKAMNFEGVQPDNSVSYEIIQNL